MGLGPDFISCLQREYQPPPSGGGDPLFAETTARVKTLKGCSRFLLPGQKEEAAVWVFSGLWRDALEKRGVKNLSLPEQSSVAADIYSGVRETYFHWHLFPAGGAILGAVLTRLPSEGHPPMVLGAVVGSLLGGMYGMTVEVQARGDLAHLLSQDPEQESRAVADFQTNEAFYSGQLCLSAVISLAGLAVLITRRGSRLSRRVVSSVAALWVVALAPEALIARRRGKPTQLMNMLV